VIPYQASYTRQSNQMSELMEAARKYA
jgi:hypothetical protein